ncbi:MAG: hypothetical protein GXY34_04950 [Syntrophomonadaceae bacterium]|nr:hypothetical protein [Syntrophomonadaceae bacterium]
MTKPGHCEGFLTLNGEVWGIKEEIQENQEALVQVKTRKYCATPIKGVPEKGSFALSMARKTSVDVSQDNMTEEEPNNGRKSSGQCFICGCGSH